MRYKIMSAEMDNKGFVDIPEDAVVLGGLYHPMTGKFVVACMTPVMEQPEGESQEEKGLKEESKEGEETEEKSESSAVSE